MPATKPIRMVQRKCMLDSVSRSRASPRGLNIDALPRFLQGRRTLLEDRPEEELHWCTGTASATVVAVSCVLNGDVRDPPIASAPRSHRTCARVKPIIAPRMRLPVVRSIIRLTKADAVKDYVAAVGGRIGPSARAHMLRAQCHWQGADHSSQTAC
jgi:hypothetical protein